MFTSMRSQVIILALLGNILRVKSQSISYVEAEDKTVRQDFALRTGTFEHQNRADLDVNEKRKGGKKAGKGKKPGKPAKCSCAALKTKMESLEKGVDSILEKITDLQCTSTPPSDRKPVLVMGPVPWTVLSVEDFSQISSNSSIQDPGVTEQDAYGSVSKVIDGTLYLCDPKACRSHDGLGWKIEEGMNLLERRRFTADALFLSPQPKWIVHGEFIPTVDVWTPQSGKWIKDTNYRSPYPVDLGCIVVIEGKILQVGGRGIDGYSKRVFLGDDEKAGMKEKRIYHHCIIFEDRVWVAGGVVRGEHSVNLHKDVEIYDHKTDTWTAGPSFPEEIADRVPKLKIIQGELYYIGSYSGKIFKLDNGVWKKITENLPTNNKFIAEVVEVTL